VGGQVNECKTCFMDCLQQSKTRNSSLVRSWLHFNQFVMTKLEDCSLHEVCEKFMTNNYPRHKFDDPRIWIWIHFYSVKHCCQKKNVVDKHQTHQGSFQHEIKVKTCVIDFIWKNVNFLEQGSQIPSIFNCFEIKDYFIYLCT
jgi:hypothetical protein